jgi:16S rRNA (cytidine1402-2'-O)-methyltransferase
MPGTLYLVATPIGNLQDMTFRAIETLKSVDLIACEDTRYTRKLLNHFGVSNKLVSYHEHNETERAAEFAELLRDGRSIAVVSDAGTPGVSDPSYRVVRSAIDAGANVVPIPGAVAFVNAAVVSGLPTDSLFFGGFLPSKAGERRKRLEALRDVPATLVLYEAPHRLAKSLADCASVLGNREAAIVRELTKIHEETVRGRLSELAERFDGTEAKGEIVLVVDRDTGEAGASAVRTSISLAERVSELEQEFDHKSALKKAAKEFGLSRSEAYRRLVSEKN